MNDTIKHYADKFKGNRNAKNAANYLKAARITCKAGKLSKDEFDEVVSDICDYLALLSAS